MILAKEQRIGAIILFGIAIIAWIVMALYPSTPPAPETPKKKSWAERKDSIRLADSLRYVQWKEEREQRYDSFRMADSLRHEAWKIERQHRWDSMRIADSLWRDSVGMRFTKRVKKDTVLDLNHCDTTELQLLRGIGRFTALQIVRYREQLGGFYLYVNTLRMKHATAYKQQHPLATQDEVATESGFTSRQALSNAKRRMEINKNA